MAHPLSWFEKRKGSFVYRGTTKVFIDTLETANKLYYLQDKKYTFTCTEDTKKV